MGISLLLRRGFSGKKEVGYGPDIRGFLSKDFKKVLEKSTNLFRYSESILLY